MKAGFLSRAASHNGPLCPHAPRLTADSTALILVTQGSPHPEFLPSDAEGPARTGQEELCSVGLGLLWDTGLPPGVAEDEGGVMPGVAEHLQAETLLGPKPAASLNKLTGDISSTIRSFGEGNTVLSTSQVSSETLRKHRAVLFCFVFLIVYTG